MVIGLLLYGYCTVIPWHGYGMVVDRYRMVIVYLLFVDRVVIARLWHGSLMPIIIVQLLYGYCVFVIWLLHGCCMVIACWRYGYCMVVIRYQCLFHHCCGPGGIMDTSGALNIASRLHGYCMVIACWWYGDCMVIMRYQCVFIVAVALGESEMPLKHWRRVASTSYSHMNPHLSSRLVHDQMFCRKWLRFCLWRRLNRPAELL